MWQGSLARVGAAEAEKLIDPPLNQPPSNLTPLQSNPLKYLLSFLILEVI